MLWSRVSKAFERSRKIFSGLFLLSIFVMILSVSSSAACSVSCQITGEQSARNSFRRQHIGEHCPFKLNTSQNCSVEFGYIVNPRNGEVVLDYTSISSA